MAKNLSDFKVGDKISSSFEGIDRELIKKYANASGDTNPIHTRDEIAEKAGLKGVIAHGLLSFGFVIKLLDEQVGDNGKVLNIYGEMRGQVRPKDTLITECTVTSIDRNMVNFDVLQKTITKIKIEDNGEIVKTFEAEEKGWVSNKDIEKGLIKTKNVDEGILTYRERPCILGTGSILFNE